MRKGILGVMCGLAALVLTACGESATPAPVNAQNIQTAVAATVAASGLPPTQAPAPAPTAVADSTAQPTQTALPNIAVTSATISTVTAQGDGNGGGATSVTTAAPPVETTAAQTKPTAAPTTAAPATATPQHTLPSTPPTIPTDNSFYAGKSRPFFVTYPKNWSVDVETAHGDFADLPETVKIGYPEAYNYGIHIYSGAAGLDATKTLNDFLTYERTLHPIQTGKVTTSANASVSQLADPSWVLSEEFTTTNAIGPVTGVAAVYQDGGGTYLAFSFTDTPFIKQESASGGFLITVPPLTPAIAAKVPLSPRQTVQNGGGSIQCPTAWTHVTPGDKGIKGCDNGPVGSHVLGAGLTADTYPAGTNQTALLNAILAPSDQMPTGQVITSWIKVSSDTWAALLVFNGMTIHYVRFVPLANNRFVSLHGVADLHQPDHLAEVAATMLSYKPPTQ